MDWTDKYISQKPKKIPVVYTVDRYEYDTWETAIIRMIKDSLDYESAMDFAQRHSELNSTIWRVQANGVSLVLYDCGKEITEKDVENGLDS